MFARKSFDARSGARLHGAGLTAKIATLLVLALSCTWLLTGNTGLIAVLRKTVEIYAYFIDTRAASEQKFQLVKNHNLIDLGPES